MSSDPSGSDSDSEGAKKAWDYEQPAVREVTQDQLSEFNQAYGQAKGQISQLESEILKAEADEAEALKDSESLCSLESQIAAERSMIPKIWMAPESMPKMRPKTQRREEYSSIKASYSSISSLKQDESVLSSKLSSAKALWKTEKQRLTKSLRQIEEENASLAQMISINQQRISAKVPLIDTTETITPHAIKNQEDDHLQNKNKEPLAATNIKEMPAKEQSWPITKHDLVTTTFEMHPDMSWIPKSPPSFAPTSESTVTTFHDGTKEVISSSLTTIFFSNGDVRLSFPSGRTSYFYSSTKVAEHTDPSGFRLVVFPSGQSELYSPSGKAAVIFPDGTRKIIE